jgi:hypothetical protein
MKAMLKTGIALFLFAAASLVYAQTADELETPDASFEVISRENYQDFV